MICSLWILAVLGCSIPAVQPSSAHAGPLFFSVDRNSDELVQIDAPTGQVTVIGSLGFNALDTDLVLVGNRLYATNSNFQVRVDLHEIDTATGVSLSSVQGQTGSGPITSAEGLAQDGGQLKIGYSTAGDAFSNALGDLALSGTITNTQTGDPEFDFDGLGAHPVTGMLYGSDRFPSHGSGGTNTVDFFTVNESPLAINVFKTVSSSFGVNDVAVLGNTLYAIDNMNNQLRSIDLSTTAFSSVNLDRSGWYFGLANATVVPEPGSLVLWAIGATICVVYGYRNRKRRLSSSKFRLLAIA